MSELQLGSASVVITPPVGVRLAGYAARTSPSVGILDDLYARALVFSSGATRLALLSCDIIHVDRSVAAAVRQQVRRLTGIPEDAVMVCATHTHSGPMLETLPEYSIDHLVDQLAGAVFSATHAMKPVRLRYGTSPCGVGANRRYRSSPTAPYFLYLDPDGVSDTDVRVLVAETSDGHIGEVLFNYACHPVTLGPNELNISRDILDPACSTVRAVLGNGVLPVFLQGCAGNINPRWIYDRPDLHPAPPRIFPDELEPRLTERDRLGHLLGAAVIAAVEGAGSLDPVRSLRADRRELSLALARAALDGIAASAGTGGNRPARAKYPMWEQRMSESGGAIATEVQLFRIGSVAIVGLPGEVFVEYQFMIRKIFEPNPVLVVELANDNIQYVPTPTAFAEGGYEPTDAFLVPAAGQRLVDAVASLADGVVE